jgi:putative flippase GtrA
MVVFSALNALFGLRFGKDVSFVLAYPPAIALHFWLNKTWAFGGGRPHSVRQVLEYLAMVLVAFVIQASVFKALTAYTSLPGWAAAAGANVLQAGLTFTALHFHIFRRMHLPE